MWAPWEVYKKNQVVLPIYRPPCEACAYWRPIRQYTSAGAFCGVRLCHGEDMHPDFSCFRQVNLHAPKT